MTPVAQAYLAGVLSMLFAGLAAVGIRELVLLRAPRSSARFPTARQMRREMRARAIKRVA